MQKYVYQPTNMQTYSRSCLHTAFSLQMYVCTTKEQLRPKGHLCIDGVVCLSSWKEQSLCFEVLEDVFGQHGLLSHEPSLDKQFGGHMYRL